MPLNDAIMRPPGFEHLNDALQQLAHKRFEVGDMDERGAYQHVRNLRLGHLQAISADAEVRGLSIVSGERLDRPTRTVKTSQIFDRSFASQSLTSFLNHHALPYPNFISVEEGNAMLLDGAVQQGFSHWKGLLNRADWEIQCDDPVQKEFLRQVITDVWSDLTDKVNYHCLKEGSAAIELVWRTDPDYRMYEQRGDPPEEHEIFRRSVDVIDYVKDLDPRTYKIKIIPTGEFFGIEPTRGKNKGNTIAEGFPLLHVSHEGYNGNHWGTPILLAAYGAWFWKQMTTHFKMRYYERQGSGLLVIQHPATGFVTWEDKNGLKKRVRVDKHSLELANAVLATGVVAFPFEPDPKTGKNQWDLQFKQSEQRGRMWEFAEQHWNQEIGRALRFPDRSIQQDSRSGSSASSVGARDLFTEVLSERLSPLEVGMNKVVRLIQRANYHPDNIRRATFRFFGVRIDRAAMVLQAWTESQRQGSALTAVGQFPKHALDQERAARQIGMPIKPFSEVYEQKDISVSNDKRERQRQKEDIEKGLAADNWIKQGRKRIR